MAGGQWGDSGQSGDRTEGGRGVGRVSAPAARGRALAPSRTRGGGGDDRPEAGREGGLEGGAQGLLPPPSPAPLCWDNAALRRGPEAAVLGTGG